MVRSCSGQLDWSMSVALVANTMMCTPGRGTRCQQIAFFTLNIGGNETIRTRKFCHRGWGAYTNILPKRLRVVDV
jgi:hypothetical protein